MADRVRWVIFDKDDGSWLCRDEASRDGWGWSFDRSDAHEFDSRDEARRELVGCVLTARIRRRGPKPDRLILTGEAARLVREWREKPLRKQSVAAVSKERPWLADMLAALAGEEVRDG